jgi:hypothetical protein
MVLRGAKGSHASVGVSEYAAEDVFAPVENEQPAKHGPALILTSGRN